LVKVESQEYDYKQQTININRVGFFSPFPVPPDSILCAMKLSALLTRKKGGAKRIKMACINVGFVNEKWSQFRRY
jgi:hypothetical protein